jgi:hypothetical protein
MFFHPFGKLVLIGTAFAIVAAAIVGGWTWYQGRPKPWNTKAIVASFDYPDTESGPVDKNGFRPDQFVLYYTLENTTDLDYRLPPRDQIELNAKLRRQNSLSTNDQLLTLDDRPIFFPAKQRIRIGVHLAYSVTKDFGPQENTSLAFVKKLTNYNTLLWNGPYACQFPSRVVQDLDRPFVPVGDPGVRRLVWRRAGGICQSCEHAPR